MSDTWKTTQVGELWSGQYNMYMCQTWGHLTGLGVNWVWLSDLCVRISQEGIIKPVLVNIDEAQPRLVQGHHRYWVARMLDIGLMEVKPPQFTLLTGSGCV